MRGATGSVYEKAKYILEMKSHWFSSTFSRISIEQFSQKSIFITSMCGLTIETSSVEFEVIVELQVKTVENDLTNLMLKHVKFNFHFMLHF